MQNITFEQLVGLMAVALVLIGAYNTIMGAIKTHREEKKRKDAPVNLLQSLRATTTEPTHYNC